MILHRYYRFSMYAKSYEKLRFLPFDTHTFVRMDDPVRCCFETSISLINKTTMGNNNHTLINMSAVSNNDTSSRFRPKVLRKIWKIFRKSLKVEFILSKFALIKRNSFVHVLLELSQSFQRTYF